MELFSKNSNLCDHNSPTLQTDGQTETDRQTDRQTTCDRNTALCTKVHRAVKIAVYHTVDGYPVGLLLRTSKGALSNIIFIIFAVFDVCNNAGLPLIV